ncbi:MAG: ADP-ribosylglycohydrolase family protein [Actinomycetota bacterium]|jgi:ADP-ribosylglycohydrolase|nr:ADP-ribosylglycohydrolase family protein [Actinomycetota bacterium]
MAKNILDAVYGCLIGGAIGDALGAPVEGWHYADIREEYGKVEEFMPGSRGVTTSGIPGRITDDSALRHYMCLAIVRKGGRITPDDYARVWLEDLNPDRLFFTERIALQKLRLGMNPWETGRGQPLADAATMSIAPIGIINAGNPAQAYQDGFTIALIHQDGVERDAAATMAAGFAAAFAPDATVDGVLETVEKHSSYEVRRPIVMAMDLARDSGTVDEFTEKFYATMLDRSFPVPPDQQWDKDRSVSPTSREILPLVATILHLCEGDANRCIVEGASFGRDCDTIASVVGGLAGAMDGADAIRKDWIDECEKANEEFFVEVEGDRRANFYRMAARLVEAMKSEKRAIQEQLEMLSRITG